MAWNLTDDSYVKNSNNHTVGEHNFSIKSSKEIEIFNVLSKLKQFKDEQKFCDLIISANDVEFRAHKAVVAAWSPKLASLLSQDEDAAGVVIHTDNVKAVDCCLDYLYTGFISPDDLSVHALLELGRSLLIDSLVDACESYLQKNVGLQNFVSKYFLSLKFNLKVLEEIIVDFIETNIANIIEQPGLLNLTPSDFKSFLTIGKMKDLKQEARFSLIISWVGFDISGRDKFLMYLFDHIDWTHSVNDLLIKISCSQNIFTTSEFCLFQLLHSLVTAMGHHLGPFITTYPRLFAIYSHMIEELSHPEAFSVAGQFHKELELLSVSPIHKKSSTEIPKELKEVAVNTEFEYDLSAFQSIIPLENAESSSETCLSVDNNEDRGNKDVAKSNVTPLIEASKFEIDGKNSVSETALEATQPNVTHRRKSLPRKLPQKSNSREPKEKKRKPRKQTTKENNIIESNELTEDNQKKNASEELLNTSHTEKDETMDYVLLSNLTDASADDHKTDGTENIVSAMETEVLDDKINNSTEKKPKTRIKLTFKRGKQPSLSKTKSKSKMAVTQKLTRPPPVSKSSRPRVHCTYENCDFSAKLPHVLEKHIARVHLINVSLCCWKCEFKATEMRDLCQHLKEHFPKSPFCCDFENCGVKFLRLGLLVRHHMSHMKEKPYQCDYCMKTFATYNQLSCHKKLHSGPQFECDVCYRKFGTKGVMQQHRAIHFDNKPYLCDLCGFSTKHQSHLISHRKIHTGDVKRCTFPNCNYSTPKAGHMTQHMNSHLNIRNHICQVCGKSFVVRSKLLRHERIHLKEKLFKCKQCEYQTSRTDRMKLHIESHGIKLKRKNKNNMNSGFDYDSEPEIDFHQLYEKVQPEDDSGLPTQVSLSSSNQMSNIPYLSISEIKPMDVISFAASSSMIMDNYNATRLSIDHLNPATVACIDDIQAAATYQQNFERIQTTAFDQL